MKEGILETHKHTHTCRRRKTARSHWHRHHHHHHHNARVQDEPLTVRHKNSEYLTCLCFTWVRRFPSAFFEAQLKQFRLNDNITASWLDRIAVGGAYCDWHSSHIKSNSVTRASFTWLDRTAVGGACCDWHIFVSDDRVSPDRTVGGVCFDWHIKSNRPGWTSLISWPTDPGWLWIGFRSRKLK